jgi:3-oxoacyl-[acyl-carrier protein] reductase
MELSGKVALVTGAGQGIGRAYVLALAQAGATVIAASRRMGAPAPGGAPAKNTLLETVQLARAQGLSVEAMLCDVGDEAQIARLADEIIANHGRIDIVVNNAATYPGAQPAPHEGAMEITAAEWDSYLRINFLGPYFIISRLAPHMIARRSGSIINITSLAALGSTPGSGNHEGLLPYGATKAALNRLTTYFAAELKPHGIAVNALHPGLIMTASWSGLPEDKQAAYAANPRVRPATPEAIGAAMLFLARQTADGITGQVLNGEEFGQSWP